MPGVSISDRANRTVGPGRDLRSIVAGSVGRMLDLVAYRHPVRDASHVLGTNVVLPASDCAEPDRPFEHHLRCLLGGLVHRRGNTRVRGPNHGANTTV